MAANEFNAYELLAKLRGGQPLPESSVGGAVPENPHAKHAQHTSVQKRERIEVRVELEKDIAKLNEEITKLKFENKALQAEKCELQDQFRDYKEKTDDTISQLRNTIIGLRKRVNTGGGGGGVANAANNFDGTGASNRLAIPGRNSARPLTDPAINRQLQYLPPPPVGLNQFGLSPGDNQENQYPRNVSPPAMGGSYSSIDSSWQHTAGTVGSNGSPSPPKDTSKMFPGTTKSTLRRNSNFAGPTFSELMRRSAPEYKNFASSLRDTKAFYVATPKVITNANQDPEFQVVRRASMAMHAAKLEAQQAALAAAYGDGGENGMGNHPSSGHMPHHGHPHATTTPGSVSAPPAAPPGSGEHETVAPSNEDNIANRTVQHKPFAW